MKTKEIIEILSIIVLVSPTFVMHYGNALLIYGFIALETFSVVYISYINRFRLMKNRFFLSIVLLEVTVVIFTLTNSGLSSNSICVIISEIVLSYHVLANCKKRPLKTVFLFSKAFELLMYLDLVTIIIGFIKGNPTDSSIIFVGHKNYHSLLFVLAIGFILLNNSITKGHAIDTKVVCFLLVSSAVELLVDSASGAVAIAILVFLSFIMTKRNIGFINLTSVVIALITFNFMLVFSTTRVQVLANILSFIGRDVGFTGRARLWTVALSTIQKNPLIGHGFNYQLLAINFQSRTVYNHCHNFFLNILLSGGVIYLIAFLSMMLFISVIVRKRKGEISNILTYIIGCYLLIGTSEILVNVMPMFFPLMVFSYSINSLYISKSQQRKRKI